MSLEFTHNDGLSGMESLLVNVGTINPKRAGAAMANGGTADPFSLLRNTA